MLFTAVLVVVCLLCFVLGYLLIGLLVVAGCCYLRYCSCTCFYCGLLVVYLCFGCGFGLLVWWLAVLVVGLLLFSALLSVSLGWLFLVLLPLVWWVGDCALWILFEFVL